MRSGGKLSSCITFWCKLVKPKRARSLVQESLGTYSKWRLLLAEYEPRVPGRHQAMLGGLLAPTGWKNLTRKQFETALMAWELTVNQYQAQSGKMFGDGNKVAVILKWSPDEIRKPLMSGHPCIRDNSALLRASVFQLIKGDVD